MRLDGVLVGRLAYGDGRWRRQRKWHYQLHHRCEHGIRWPRSDVDGWHGHLHAESERLVHLYRYTRHADRREYCVHRFRHGDNVEWMRVDGDEFSGLADDLWRGKR